MKQFMISIIFGLVLTGICQADWPIFHGDLARTGYSTEATTAGLVDLWTVDLGSPIYVSPVIADQTVFVTTADARLIALNAATGSQLWQMSLGSWLEASPTLWEGRIYTGCIDHNLYCYDTSTGSLLWQAETGSWLMSSPLVFDNKVYIGSFDHHLYAFDAFTGSEIFSIHTGGDVMTAPSTGGQYVYFSGDDEIVHAITPEGNPVWSVQAPGAVYGAPVVSENKVIYGSIANGEGLSYNRLTALDAGTGAQIWQVDFAEYDFLYGTPAAGYGNVYIGGFEGSVWAFDLSDGSLVWERSLGDWALLSSPALSNGVLYIGSNDGTIYALDAFTGVVLDETETDYFVEASPAVSDGQLVIGSADGTIRAYSLDAAVEVAVTPVVTSVSPGETLEFDLTLTELIGQPQTFLAWMRITAPAGGQRDIGNPVTMMLSAYQQRQVLGRLNIPGSAPLGDFYLAVNVGSTQTEIWDASSFGFSIVSSGEGNPPGDNWSFTFSDEISGLIAGPVLPVEFWLHPPYPNPFNPNTDLSFSLPQGSVASLNVYDASGRLVETLIEKSIGAGIHTVSWNAANQASGVYFFRLNAGERTAVQRGVLTK